MLSFTNRLQVHECPIVWIMAHAYERDVDDHLRTHVAHGSRRNTRNLSFCFLFKKIKISNLAVPRAYGLHRGRPFVLAHASSSALARVV